MKKNLKALGIVIVNYNSRYFLKACLDSIAASQKSLFQLKKIIIVDNASTDDSLLCVRNFNLAVQVIKNQKNIGFAKACNQGAFSMINEIDYVLFLNPDCELFPDTLDKTLNVLIENPLIGVCGPQVVDGNNMIVKTCAKTPRFFDFVLGISGIAHIFGRGIHDINFDHKHSKSVEHLMGCYYLMPAKLFNSFKGFDEDFFVYLEDLDLSSRIINTGAMLYFYADAKLKHYGGGCSEQVKAYRLAYSTRSRYIYIKKYFGLSRAKTFLVLTVLVEFPLRCIKELLKLNFKGLLEVTKAYGLFLRKKLY